MFVIEFGCNHLGKKKYINKMLDFFIKSSFNMATIQLLSKEYYSKNPIYLSIEKYIKNN